MTALSTVRAAAFLAVTCATACGTRFEDTNSGLACELSESEQNTPGMGGAMEGDGSTNDAPVRTEPSDGPSTVHAARCPSKLFTRTDGKLAFVARDSAGDSQLWVAEPGEAAVAVGHVEADAVFINLDNIIILADQNGVARWSWSGGIEPLWTWTLGTPTAITATTEGVFVAVAGRIYDLDSETAVATAAGVTSLAGDGKDLYWTTSTQLVRRLDGQPAEVILSDLERATRVAVDESAIYVLTGGAGEGKLLWLPKDLHEKPVLLASPRGATDFAASSSHLYYAEPDRGEIKRVGKSGTTPAVSLVAGLEPGKPQSIALGEDDKIYWSLGCGGTQDGIRTLSKKEVGPSGCGSEPRTVLSEWGGTTVTAMAVQGTWIFAAVEDNGETSIERVWRNGGTPARIAGALGQVTQIVADEDGVVFVDETSGKLFQLARSADAPVVLTTDASAPLALASSGVYFRRGSDLVRVDRRTRAETNLGPRATGRFLVDKGTLVVVRNMGTVMFVDRAPATAAGGPFSTFMLPVAATSVDAIAAGRDRIHVAISGASGSTWLAIDLATKQVEHAPLESTPHGIVAISDDVLVAARSGNAPAITRYAAKGRSRAMSEDYEATAFSADSRCLVYATSSKSGTVVRKVSRWALGVRDADEEIVWEAQLHPVNTAALTGIKEVHGTTRAVIRGDTLTVTTIASGLAPNVGHPHHIHRNSTCATLANDNNGDNHIDIIESLRVHKGVIVPLDSDLATLGAGVGFPIANADGTICYQSTTSLSALEEARGEDLALETRAAVIHGTAPGFVLPQTVAGVEGVRAQRNIPLACGAFARLEDNSATGEHEHPEGE